MTKDAIIPEFITAIENNQLHYEVDQWVKKSINSSSKERKTFNRETIGDWICTIIPTIMNN